MGCDRTQQTQTQCFCPFPHIEPEASIWELLDQWLQTPTTRWRGAETDGDNGLAVPPLWRCGRSPKRSPAVDEMETLITAAVCADPRWLDLVCVCEMAPTFHSPLPLPLLTSAALHFENSDRMVRGLSAGVPVEAAAVFNGVLASALCWQQCVCVWRLKTLLQMSRTRGSDCSKHTADRPLQLPWERLCWETTQECRICAGMSLHQPGERCSEARWFTSIPTVRRHQTLTVMVKAP